ncbi:hypothetical protein LUI11_42905 [Bradyrhizobium diazoefficiens]|uniref:hypothetical protein n=1 Tax=Bradyrhizobium diazoefficiens TaxID=1355477 RepID=UPI001E4E28DA|nr:hypothetical protein [Bradyrhizobium diazoefficiens]MCD9889416.1 hypothetical protein [Bradyrhizobium diazoefficiens]
MPPSPIDPARLAALPADLRALFRAQEAMIEAERRRADDECSARLHVESELAASKESVERLELLVKEYERTIVRAAPARRRPAAGPGALPVPFPRTCRASSR